MNFKNWWDRFRYNASIRLQNFMVGRYGNPDDLYRFQSGLSLVLIILNIFFHSKIIYVLTLITIIHQMMRFFSKNAEARYKENQVFLRLKKRMSSSLKLLKRRWVERKDYRFRRCPACKTVLRLPNKKGTHNVRCPKCGNEFKTKI